MISSCLPCVSFHLVLFCFVLFHLFRLVLLVWFRFVSFRFVSFVSFPFPSRAFVAPERLLLDYVQRCFLSIICLWSKMDG